MTIVVLGTIGFVLIAAGMTFVARLPLRPGAYVVRRVPVSHAPLLTARLIPAPRAIAARPSAASTARQVYVITDLPAAQGARGE
jgi:hypothetical protein